MRACALSDDTLDRMFEVKQSGTTLLARYQYDALSRRTSLAFGNLATPERSPGFAKAGNAANPSLYTYAANDNLTQIVHPPSPRLRWTGKFKTQGQISYAYTYNRVGQKTSSVLSDDRFLFRPAAAANTNYSANPLNQYTQVDATAQTHDVNGNLTNDGVLTLGYDSENRLSTAAKSGMSASYAYDPLSRRKAKTVNAVTTSYLHDFDHEIAEYDAAGALLRRYVYGAGIDQPLAQITAGGTRFYYRQDGINSIVAHEEHASSFVQRFAYGPYGEAATATGHPLRYTGRRLDEETGLYYYRARMYAPATGRFLQTDPIGYQGGLNLYAYVGNDPLNATDPSGTVCVPCAFAVGGAVVGVGSQAIADYYSGNVSSFGTYAGAATGGAIGGLALMTGGGLGATVAAGAVAGASGNLVQQTADFMTGRQSNFSVTDLAPVP